MSIRVEKHLPTLLQHIKLNEVTRSSRFWCACANGLDNSMFSFFNAQYEYVRVSIMRSRTCFEDEEEKAKDTCSLGQARRDCMIMMVSGLI
jgi:hypothetical protein